MRRSIVPEGFESLAHDVFRNYIDPLPVPFLLLDKGDCSTSDSGSPAKSDTKTETSDHVITVRCPICLQSVLDPVTLLGCNHLFCKECITKWFRTKIQCPLCKVSCCHFIQPCDGKEEQFHLWQTALVGGSSCKLSLSGAARQAMKAHKSHQLGFKHRREFSVNPKVSIEGQDSSTKVLDANSSTKVLDARSRVSGHIRGDLASESMNGGDLFEKTSDDSASISYVADNLQSVCEELRQLEDDLRAYLAN